MNIKKKKINRIILSIFSVFILVFSIFTIIPFNKKSHEVKADTFVDTYSFTGSPLYTKINTYINDELTNYQYDIALLYTFSTDSLGYINSIGFDFTFYNGGRHIRSYSVSENIGYFDYTISISGLSQTFKFNYQFSNSRLMGRPIGYNLYCDNNAYGEFSFMVNYFDADNNFLLISHTFKGAATDYYDLPLRTYYFEDAFNLSDNQYYNQGYSEGYSEGYTDGEATGLNTGYTNGFNTGKDEGFWLGYNTALDHSDTYSFTNLISAVIDVPVRTFTSLFNFEILGVNLSGFFLGLLTCCIVLSVIRLIF